MTEVLDEKRKSLDAAWAKREAAWKEATARIEAGNRLWKDIVNLPGSSRVDVWFSISEACLEAAEAVRQGYERRLQSDLVWRDALLSVYGSSCRVSWEWVPERKSNRCTLNTGEVFEP